MVTFRTHFGDVNALIRFVQENLIVNQSNNEYVNCGSKEGVSVLKRVKQNIPFKLKRELCKKVISSATQLEKKSNYKFHK